MTWKSSVDEQALPLHIARRWVPTQAGRLWSTSGTKSAKKPPDSGRGLADTRRRLVAPGPSDQKAQSTQCGNEEWQAAWNRRRRDGFHVDIVPLHECVRRIRHRPGDGIDRAQAEAEGLEAGGESVGKVERRRPAAVEVEGHIECGG